MHIKQDIYFTTICAHLLSILFLCSVLDKADEAKILNNNKDEIIEKYKLKKNRQEV